MVSSDASEAAALAIRAFVARVGGRADAECAISHPDDVRQQATVDAQWRAVFHGDLERVTPAELEELVFHTHRLFNGANFMPVPQKLRVQDMGPMARGRRRAFESGPRSAERIGHHQIVIRWGRLFTFGTHDERASLDSIPTYERDDARAVLSRLRALCVLDTWVAPQRWKKWVPLGKKPDLVARAQVVLEAVVHQAASGFAGDSVSIHDLAWLGRVSAILIAERGPASVERLVQLAEAVPGMHRWIGAHIDELRDVPELAPVVLATPPPWV